MATFTWSDRDGRYRDARGRYVADSVVRRVVDQVADHASERLARAAQEMLDGTRSLASFQLELMQTAKLAMLSGGALARGGAAQMRQSDYGYLGRQIRDQYQYARAFAQDIASGRQPLNATLASRAAMYGQQSRVAFENVRGRDQRDRGYASCRNVLHARESCRSCREQTRRGWVPIGSLAPVGQRTCLSRCRCTISYRREAAEAAA